MAEFAQFGPGNDLLPVDQSDSFLKRTPDNVAWELVPYGGAPPAVATTGAEGVADSPSRSDHTHGLPFTVVNAALATASAPVALNSQPITGVADPTSAQDVATKNYVDTTIGGGIPFDTTVTVVDGGPPTAGSAQTVSRGDHKHTITSATPLDVGSANSMGGSWSVALADHVHAHGAQTNPTMHALASHSSHGFMSAVDKAKFDVLVGSVFNGMVTTTDATPTTVFSVNLSTLPATVTSIVATVIGIRTDGADNQVCGFRVHGYFQSYSTYPPRQVGPTMILSKVSDAGITVQNVDFSSGAGVINIIVTGSVGETISWRATGSATVVS